MHSANSTDSRFWGFVPKENVLGKAVYRWWPLNRMGRIKA
jgi:signal peptidase I